MDLQSQSKPDADNNDDNILFKLLFIKVTHLRKIMLKCNKYLPVMFYCIHMDLLKFRFHLVKRGGRAEKVPCEHKTTTYFVPKTNKTKKRGHKDSFWFKVKRQNGRNNEACWGRLTCKRSPYSRAKKEKVYNFQALMLTKLLPLYQFL